MKGCNVEEAARAMADIEDTTLDMLAVLVADSARLDKLERMVRKATTEATGVVLHASDDKIALDIYARSQVRGETLREAIDAVEEVRG